VISDLAELDEPLPAGTHTWVDVRGLGDESILRALAKRFGIHDLALEDAVNVPQRAKAEVHEGHLVVIGRVPQLDEEGTVHTPQVCLLLSETHLVTFQERYFGFFDAVRQRLREGVGPIRRSGPDYLAWALVDTLTDHYYPVAEQFSEELTDLEEDALEANDPETLTRIHRVRRQLAVFRRIGWPMREAVGRLARGKFPYVSDEARRYFRDTEDHLAQLMELGDSLREIAVDLTEIFMSQVSHRSNEIMKVLTLMASIFIPLTFIAGVYGMNFENMPELRAGVGYPLVLGVMVLVAVAMLVYFRRRGWLGRRRRHEDPPH